MLAGESPGDGPGDPQGADKTFDFVLSLGDARDVRIDARGVFVRSQLARGAHGYFGWTAPGVVARLMRAMLVANITGPTVGIVPSVAPYRTTKIPRQLAWLLPTRGGLEARLRPVPAALDPFEPRPIPDEGPLALPAPVELAPFTANVALVEHGRDVACPHCRVVARRHRDARDGWMVCAACGRSFRPGSISD
jgi:DNA-directed RNA polymerase subunit RPC12/RpoP